MINVADRKDIRKAEKAAKIAEMHDREAIKSIMSTIHGRAWMFRRLESCHIFNDPFTGDALREAYTKGERNFGLSLFAQLMMYCPDQYIQMTREANERDTANQRDPDESADGTGSAEHSGSTDSGRIAEGPDSTARDGAAEGQATRADFDPEAEGWNLYRPGDLRVHPAGGIPVKQ